MNQGQSDIHTTHLERPYASKMEHALAYVHLQRRHAEGGLPPFHDGTEDVVADYASILGLTQRLRPRDIKRIQEIMEGNQ